MTWEILFCISAKMMLGELEKRGILYLASVIEHLSRSLSLLLEVCYVHNLVHDIVHLSIKKSELGMDSVSSYSRLCPQLFRFQYSRQSTDGFHLANADLLLHGRGNLLRKKQKGHFPQFPIARLDIIDENVLQEAHASQWQQLDLALSSPIVCRDNMRKHHGLASLSVNQSNLHGTGTGLCG
ncbi:hypothetical protein MANES_17G077300v8 [Manihot esculenta]|uniref:Uncharacterized protein n=1 Tax=Manihot esculenta TaxID=3983 RepID=A0ACB7G4T2_MANES|nr:hypothetical protein MANES_17G077300v8 [Manihot esculenta]